MTPRPLRPPGGASVRSRRRGASVRRKIREAGAGRASLAFEVAVELFVGAGGFQVNEAYAVIAGVTQQVEQAQTAERENPQRREIAFFFSPMSGSWATASTAESTSY